MARLDDLFVSVWSTPAIRALAESNDVSGLLTEINARTIDVEIDGPLHAVELFDLLGTQRAASLASSLQEAAAQSAVVSLIFQGFATNGFNPSNPSHRSMIAKLVAFGALTSDDQAALLSLATTKRSLAELALGRAATEDEALALIAWVSTKNGKPKAIGYEILSIEPIPSVNPTVDRIVYVLKMADGDTVGPYVQDRPVASREAHEAWVGLQALAFNAI